jgi:hypothetical protein
MMTTTDRSFARNWMLRQMKIAVICAALVAVVPDLWSGPRTVPTDVEVAERFVVSLNHGNTRDLVSESECPFVFRNQEWESATDGSGFVHGKADDQSFKNKKALATLFSTLVSKVQIENEKAATRPPSKDSLLLDNLKGAPADWQKLNLILFRRGFGDVEHVAIVGVDSATHRVRGLYLN